MRACHGRARNGVRRGVAADPRGGYVHARRIQIQDRAVVGEVGGLIGNVSRADCQCLRDARGRLCTGVQGIIEFIAVACGNSIRHAAGNGVSDRRIEWVISWACEAHVSDGGRGEGGRDPIDARDHGGKSTGATAIQNTHGMNRHAFSDAVRSAAQSAGHMRAMPVTIVAALPVADKVCGDGSASAEILVGWANTRVEDVSVNACACKIVGVETVKWEVTLVYAIKPPGGRIELARRSVNLTILGHVLDARVIAESDGGSFRQSDGETPEGMFVDVPSSASVSACKFGSQRGDIRRGRLIFEHHDILVGNGPLRPSEFTFRGLCVALSTSEEG